MGSGRREWLNLVFGNDLVECICSMPIPVTEKADKMLWKGRLGTGYTVREAYEARSQGQEEGNTPSWSWMWSLDVEPRVICFIWKLARA